jgi:hypothetical protein
MMYYIDHLSEAVMKNPEPQANQLPHLCLTGSCFGPGHLHPHPPGVVTGRGESENQEDKGLDRHAAASAHPTADSSGSMTMQRSAS